MLAVILVYCTQWLCTQNLYRCLPTHWLCTYTTGTPSYPALKAVNPMFPMVVHPRSVALLVYPMVVYARCIPLLVYPTVVYTSSDISLAYPTVVYTKSISLLAYQQLCMYTNGIPHYPVSNQSTKFYFLNGYVP